MSVVGYRARNHPQQVKAAGARPEVDDRATSWEDFRPLHARFQFTVDAAASPRNAKLPRYWTAEDDGLAQPWARERVYCNPPYSYPNLHFWVAKAWAEHESAEPPEIMVMLVPANRTEQRWWQELIEPRRDRHRGLLRTEFLPGRLQFIAADKPGIGPNERPPFGCCLLIWGHGIPEPAPVTYRQGDLFGDGAL